MARFPLVFGDVEDNLNPLLALDSDQAKYLIAYLRGLRAKRFILESAYFDRDYLAEFAAYYSTCARSYSNCCMRIHFFDGFYKSDEIFHRALGGDKVAARTVNKAYIGFVVLRPIPKMEIGRTVLRWYRNRRTTERVIAPSRDYKVHLAGLPLVVNGLAWQQQDAAVAACATVGVWTILHSSAFDDNHNQFVPTTVDITRAAEGFGYRTFPSDGLTIEQIQEAIKKLRLAPIGMSGPKKTKYGESFLKSDFASICASFIRSGYPVLLGCVLLCLDDAGELQPVEKHAVCAVGLRESEQVVAGPEVVSQDSQVSVFYIHDDNIGPGVRFKLIELDGAAALQREQPDYLSKDQIDSAFRVLVPNNLIIAVHDNFRVSPHKVADLGHQTATIIGKIILRSTKRSPILKHSTSFFRLSEYLGDGLGLVLPNKPKVLSKVRQELAEIGPLSLTLAVIRLSWDDRLVMDLILDTTDGDYRLRRFAHVVYDELLNKCFNAVDQLFDGGVRNALELGEAISAI